MKAITIIQPYAELIASGVKRVENRVWPTSYRGPLAIHAGKAQRYGGESVRDLAQEYDIDPASLVFGAVIATANLVDCLTLEKLCRDRLWARAHVHAEGPFCWVLEEVQRIQPVTIDGKQGLWEWNGGAA